MNPRSARYSPLMQPLEPCLFRVCCFLSRGRRRAVGEQGDEECGSRGHWPGHGPGCRRREGGSAGWSSGSTRGRPSCQGPRVVGQARPGVSSRSPWHRPDATRAGARWHPHGASQSGYSPRCAAIRTPAGETGHRLRERACRRPGDGNPPARLFAVRQSCARDRIIPRHAWQAASTAAAVRRFQPARAGWSALSRPRQHPEGAAPDSLPRRALVHAQAQRAGTSSCCDSLRCGVRLPRRPEWARQSPAHSHVGHREARQ